MNGRIYDPVLARFLSPDPYVQAPDFTQSYNRYAYCWNNPFKYEDPTGEFITFSIGKKGFSIGFNLTPIGIPLGGGINVGWSGGGSVGVYAETGFRVGNVGVTASQSLDYGFQSGWSTTSSAGVHVPFGQFFNAGANVSYNHTHKSWGWGVSSGANLFKSNNDAWGMGINIGYGSGGWTYGIGGHYNPPKPTITTVHSSPNDGTSEGTQREPAKMTKGHLTRPGERKMHTDTEQGLLALWESSWRYSREMTGYYIDEGIIIAWDSQSTRTTTKFRMFEKNGELYVRYGRRAYKVNGLVHTHPEIFRSGIGISRADIDAFSLYPKNFQIINDRNVYRMLAPPSRNNYEHIYTIP